MMVKNKAELVEEAISEGKVQENEEGSRETGKINWGVILAICDAFQKRAWLISRAANCP